MPNPLNRTLDCINRVPAFENPFTAAPGFSFRRQIVEHPVYKALLHQKPYSRCGQTFHFVEKPKTESIHRVDSKSRGKLKSIDIKNF